MRNNQKINIKETIIKKILSIRNCVKSYDEIIKKEKSKLKDNNTQVELVEKIKNKHIYKIIFSNIIGDLK